MKALIVTHYAMLYGANRALFRSLQSLRKAGVLPLVLAPCEGPFLDELRQAGFETRILPFRLTMTQRPALLDSCRRVVTNARIARLAAGGIAGAGFDLVYSNSAATDFGTRLAGCLALPHIWHLREFGDLDYNLYPCFGRGHQRRALMKSRRVVSVSRAVCRHYLGADNHPKVTVIHEGVAGREALESLRGRAIATALKRRPGDDFVFVIAGLMQPRKGQHLAINAFAQVAKRCGAAKLWLIGAGGAEYERRCRDLASELGVADRVSFLGYQKEPMDFFLKADAGLMCSEAEGYGLTTLECMACSRPVIGNSTGATPEIIEDGKTGLLYDGNVETLAHCMWTLATNTATASTMGENAWRRVRDMFPLENGQAALHSIFDSCASREPVTVSGSPENARAVV